MCPEILHPSMCLKMEEWASGQGANLRPRSSSLLQMSCGQIYTEKLLYSTVSSSYRLHSSTWPVHTVVFI